MNTAPNRRASDNASSPPGTSPTRRFSDMLKESNGEGDVLVVGVVQTVDGNEVIETLTKTYREIKNAAFAVIVMESDDEYTFRRNIEIVTSLFEEDGAYVVNEIYDTDNVDGYPSNRGNGK